MKIKKGMRLESKARFICGRMFKAHPELGWKADVRMGFDDGTPLDWEGTF